MQRKSPLTIIISVWISALTMLVSGCSTDPAKAKVKYLESGKRYMEKGNHDQAIIQFQNALKQDPRFTDAFVALGKAHLANHDVGNAYPALQQAILLDPGRIDAHLSMGELYVSARMYSKAQEEASMIVNKDPANAPGYQLLGLSLAPQLQTERAAEAFSKAVALQPTDATAYVNLAMAAVTLKQYHDAEVHLRKAIELDPHYLMAYTNLANLYRLQKNVPAGEQALHQGVEKNPDDTDLSIAWADFLYAQQKKAEADAAFNKLRSRQPNSASVALAIGDFYSRRQETEKALNEYRRGFQVDGKNTQIQNHLVDCLLSAGRLDEAEKMNEQTLKQHPKDVLAGIARGRILVSQNKSADAVDLLENVVGQAPELPQVHYGLAMAYWQNQRLPQAKTELMNALKIDPRMEAANQSLAKLHLALGEIAEARLVAEQLVQQDPASPADHVLLGNIYLRLKNPVKAREHFLVARDFAPGAPDVVIGLAQAYADERKFPEAEAELENLLNQQPQFTPALQSIANLYTGRNQRAKAIARVELHVRQYPNDANAHLLLGGLQMRETSLDAAKTEFTRALELDPKLLEAALQLGGVFQKEGKLDLAIQQFEKVLQTEPKISFLHTLIADLYRKLNKRDLAMKHYEQALAIDPNFVEALNNLAWMYTNEGNNLDVALGMAQKAKQLKPDSPIPTDTLAWIQYKKGLYAGAIPLLEECVAKSPESSLFHYHLGAALFASGERGKAKTQLETAMRLKLTNEDVQDARRILAQLR